MLPNVRRFIKIYKGYEWSFWVSQILQAIATIFTLLIPLMTQSLIDRGLSQGDRDATVQSVLWMVLFAVLAAVFTLANSFYAVTFAENTAHAVRMFLYRKIQTFSFGNLDRFPTSDLMVRMTNDVNAIKTTIQLIILSIAQVPVMFVGALALIYLNSPSLMWILFVVIPVIVALLLVLVVKIGPLFEIQQQKLDALNNVLQENLAGVRVVKAFVQSDFENRRYDRVNRDLRRATLRPMQYVAFLPPGLYLVINLASATVLWVGGYSFERGAVTVGEMLAFIQYLVTILVPLVILAAIAPQLTAAEASAQRMFEVLDTIPTIPEPTTPARLTPETVKGRIVFEDVSFCYPSHNERVGRPVLQNINLTIEPGQTVAFLGTTGSGKSTLVNLIPRFYDVTAGRITIDGIDVRDIPLKTLHQIVGVALQESVLFSGKVRENICYGKPDATEDEMIEAAKAADAHGFVSAIPEGYDATVARRGANFSGGQRQRLSIARAVTVKPKILILDDSTSALDMATEARVQDALKSLMADTTMLFVAQRISTVITADTIFLLEGGQIVDRGNHEQLLHSSSLYREIYNSQLGGVAA
ncbi:ATP-binding cassette domain-containing protein [Scytonema sp. UIC 10036]|uniref:ABC transporter ATP-binding protein n=1 Tax=Scytonema sp. UIC 10036 TaxID=2304196 RepID=UPI0012DAC6B2|nr:ABC transporter ATP-binding protein [Scytonema sp. UIC 10036]MUG91357.1 ATP-binding cassette domain-containing protein [Scytonema sp. UIC 10036]